MTPCENKVSDNLVKALYSAGEIFKLEKYQNMTTSEKVKVIEKTLNQVSINQTILIVVLAVCLLF